MNRNHLKTLCVGLILGLGFHAYAMVRIEKVEKDEITLQSQDGQDFSIPVKLAKLSATIKNLIEEVGTYNSIPLPTIDSKTLALLAELLPQLQELLDQTPTNPFTIGFALRPIVTGAIEKQFMDSANPDERREKILDLAVRLLLAANYLDIPYLIVSTSAVIADYIPPAARASALTFLAASAQDEKEDTLIQAREQLIQHRCSSILGIPQALRSYVMLNLSLIQLLETKKNQDLSGLYLESPGAPGTEGFNAIIALFDNPLIPGAVVELSEAREKAREARDIYAIVRLFDNPLFTPGASVVELFRNLHRARQKAWQDYEEFQYKLYDYPLPKKDVLQKLLEQAALSGNRGFIVFLSRYKLFDLNEMLDLVLRMHPAIENEQYLIVETLLNEGADPNSAKPFLPLLRAFQMRLPTRIATLLLDRGANPNADIGEFGTTLLESAERHGYTDIAERIRKTMKQKEASL